jgi:hypothetical protein
MAARCPWSQEVAYAELLQKLLHYLTLLDVGCPVERNELTDEEWIMIGLLKEERAKIAREEAKGNG